MGSSTPFSTPSLLAALCAAVFAAGCAGPIVGGGEAACAARAPRIEASPARAAPNGAFDLHGEDFFGDFVCNDTAPPGQSGPSGGRPTGGIRVGFLQGERAWTLATVGSDEDLSSDAEGLRVPAGARPGRATVRATGGSSGPAKTPFLVLGDDGGDAVSGDWEGWIATDTRGDVRASLGFELDLELSGSDVLGTMTLPPGKDAAPVRLAVVPGGLRGDRLAFSASNAEAGARTDFEGTAGSGKIEEAAEVGSSGGRGGRSSSTRGTLKAERGRDVVPGDW